MVVRSLKTALYITLTLQSLVFILLQHNYVLFTSTAAPNMRKEKFLLFCCVETSLFHDLEAGVEPESWWARYKALPFYSSYLWSFMPELWSLLRKSIRWLCHHLRLSQSIWLYTDSFPSFQIITWNPTVILNMTPYRFSKIRCCFVIRLEGLSVLDTRGNSFLVE